jgi:hypothetical protein
MSSLFNDNKYSKWYFSICNRVKSRVISEEKHHIIPRSIGGNNSKENIAYLTTREHMICHILLTKMCISKKHQTSMLYAVRFMIDRTKSVRTKFLAELRLKSFREKSKNMMGKVSTFNNLDIVKKTHITRRKNQTNPFITSNPMLNEQSKNKKVLKTSGNLHFTKNKKPFVNIVTNECKYFESRPSEEWIQQSHLKGKTRSFKGKPSVRKQCPHCTLIYPAHILNRHIKKQHENN